MSKKLLIVIHPFWPMYSKVNQNVVLRNTNTVREDITQYGKYLRNLERAISGFEKVIILRTEPDFPSTDQIRSCLEFFSVDDYTVEDAQKFIQLFSAPHIKNIVAEDGDLKRVLEKDVWEWIKKCIDKRSIVYVAGECLFKERGRYSNCVAGLTLDISDAEKQLIETRGERKEQLKVMCVEDAIFPLQTIEIDRFAMLFHYTYFRGYLQIYKDTLDNIL